MRRSVIMLAIAGVLFRVFWTDAPRWLYTPLYIALGWAAVFFAAVRVAFFAAPARERAVRVQTALCGRRSGRPSALGAQPYRAHPLRVIARQLKPDSSLAGLVLSGHGQ